MPPQLPYRDPASAQLQRYPRGKQRAKTTCYFHNVVPGDIVVGIIPPQVSDGLRGAFGVLCTKHKEQAISRRDLDWLPYVPFSWFPTPPRATVHSTGVDCIPTDFQSNSTVLQSCFPYGISRPFYPGRSNCPARDHNRGHSRIYSVSILSPSKRSQCQN